MTHTLRLDKFEIDPANVEFYKLMEKNPGKGIMIIETADRVYVIDPELNEESASKDEGSET